MSVADLSCIRHSDQQISDLQHSAEKSCLCFRFYYSFLSLQKEKKNKWKKKGRSFEQPEEQLRIRIRTQIWVQIWILLLQICNSSDLSSSELRPELMQFWGELGVITTPIHPRALLLFPKNNLVAITEGKAIENSDPNSDLSSDLNSAVTDLLSSDLNSSELRSEPMQVWGELGAITTPIHPMIHPTCLKGEWIARNERNSNLKCSWYDVRTELIQSILWILGGLNSWLYPLVTELH